MIIAEHYIMKSKEIETIAQNMLCLHVRRAEQKQELIGDATLIFLALSSPNFKDCKSSEDVDERE